MPLTCRCRALLTVVTLALLLALKPAAPLLAQPLGQFAEGGAQVTSTDQGGATGAGFSRVGPLSIVENENRVSACFPAGQPIDWRACMQRNGARPEAIAFSAMLEQMRYEGFLTGYLLRGPVDIGRVYLPTLANTNEQFVLVNGRYGVVFLHDILPRQPPTDAASRAFLHRHPDAMMSGRLFPIGYRDLPDGRQRFVFTDILTAGCRGCAVVGSAILHVDFRDGALQRTEIVGWLPLAHDHNLPSADFALTREVANRILSGDVREVQTQLNLKGFSAGSLDGVYGPQTRRALSEFLAENCQPGPESMTAEGLNRLSLQLGDLEMGFGPDANPAADTLLAALDAMHAVMQPCGPPKAMIDQYHPEFAARFGAGAAANVGTARIEARAGDAPAADRQIAAVALESLTPAWEFLDLLAGRRLLGVEFHLDAGSPLQSPVSGMVMSNRTGPDVHIEHKWLLLRETESGREHVFGHIESSHEPGQKLDAGELLGRVAGGFGEGKLHWGINRFSVWQATDAAAGWEWGHGPADATREQIADRGWIDPTGRVSIASPEPQGVSAGSTEPLSGKYPLALAFAAEFPEEWHRLRRDLGEEFAWELAHELLDVIHEFGLTEVLRAFARQPGDALHGFLMQIDPEQFTTDILFSLVGREMARFAVEQYALQTGASVDIDLVLGLSSTTAQLTIAAMTGKMPWGLPVMTFAYTRRLSQRPYQEDEKFEIVSEALLGADRLRRAAARFLQEGGTRQAEALLEFADVIVQHAAEQSVEVFRGADGPVVAELLLGMDKVIQLFRQGHLEDADNLFWELHDYARDSSPGFFSLSTNNWYQRYFMIGPQSRGGTVRAFHQLDNILRLVLAEGAADPAPRLSADAALEHAVRILLGDPYGRTPAAVRGHIIDQRFAEHDICIGGPAWIFDVHVPSLPTMPGQEIRGYIVLEDGSGEIRCIGLPFLH